MGDRSNIVVESKNGSVTDRVYLYGHWMGPDALKSAVHGLSSGRLGDDAYLTRVIFNHMTRDDVYGETGFGISPRLQDNEYPLIVIDGDSATGEVWFEEEGGKRLTQPAEADKFIKAYESLELVDDYELYDRMIEILGGE